MRDIIFRGKRQCTGEWVEGGFHSRYGMAFIIGISKALRIDGTEVIPESVGQFTGLADKNGKKIFEGDILSVNIRESIVECGCRRYTGRKIKTLWTVEYRERNAQGNGFYVFGLNRRFSLGLTRSVLYNAEPEVIGNVHDNPELLKGE